ncbi:hypothetical protein Pelo_18674 [Pelomyxa schiedti]|nr:hypothetical protein Pelo_18674 [Pelomyxa schiedti]
MNTTTTGKAQALAGTHNGTVAAWARSESFRVWADDWVLRPTADAVFPLPIMKDPHGDGDDDDDDEDKAGRVVFVLHVSVSPTMGVVSHSWFTTALGDVWGCIGHDRILVSNPCWSRMTMKFSVVNSSGKVVDPLIWEGGIGAGVSLPSTCCNRNWIVSAVKKGELLLWKVVGSCGCGEPTVVGPKYVPHGTNSTNVALSCWSCDVGMVLPQDTEGEVLFIDLESTFKRGELVEASPRIFCHDTWPCDVLFFPDGSASTIHIDMRANTFYLVNSVTHERHSFPDLHYTTVIDQSHIMVAQWSAMTNYQVYHTSNLLEPSLCVPSTWASPCHSQLSLICSTTKPESDMSGVTQVKFEVRDGATGILLGVFPVPIHPPFCFTTMSE